MGESIFSTINHSVKVRASITFDLDSILQINDQALGKEKLALMTAIRDLHVQYSQLLEKGKVSRVAFLEQQHDEIVLKAREASQTESAVMSTNSLLQQALVQADNAVGSARFQLRVALESKPKPPFATRADVAAHQAKCVALEKALEDAIKRQSNARLNVQGHSNSIANAKAALKQLKDQEKAIRAELAALTGKPLFDDESNPKPTSGIGL